MTNEIDKIVSALLKAMSNIKKAEKDGHNPHRNSRYATLASVFDACRGPLLEQGIVIVQVPFSNFEAKTVSVMTRLVHESGQWMSAGEDLAVYVPDFNAQAVGGAVTYLRRYTLTAMLGIVSDDEDDDGHRASQGRSQQNNQQQKQQNKPQGQQQRSQQSRSAPIAPAQGQQPGGKANKAQGAEPADEDHVDYTPFWKRLHELKTVTAEEGRGMVADFNNGEYGQPGSPEAFTSLMTSLEALAKQNQQQKYPRAV